MRISIAINTASFPRNRHAETINIDRYNISILLKRVMGCPESLETLTILSKGQNISPNNIHGHKVLHIWDLQVFFILMNALVMTQQPFEHWYPHFIGAGHITFNVYRRYEFESHLRKIHFNKTYFKICFKELTLPAFSVLCL